MMANAGSGEKRGQLRVTSAIQLKSKRMGRNRPNAFRFLFRTMGEKRLSLIIGRIEKYRSAVPAYMLATALRSRGGGRVFGMHGACRYDLRTESRITTDFKNYDRSFITFLTMPPRVPRSKGFMRKARIPISRALFSSMMSE